MAKNFIHDDAILGTTETDVYSASNKAMSLLIQAVNVTDNEVTAELWLTDGSNVHISPLIPEQIIPPKDGSSDTAKHVIPAGYKIRGTAGSTDSIHVEVSVLEGM